MAKPTFAVLMPSVLTAAAPGNPQAVRLLAPPAATGLRLAPSATARRRLKFAICLPTVTRPPARGGGYLNTVRFARLLGEYADVRLVSYREREPGVAFLPDIEDELIREQVILLLLWGSDVTPHVRRFHGRCPLLYYHQGIDFGVELEPDIPILCFGTFLMAHAQKTWPANPLIYMPAILEADCVNRHETRDIDVLVVRRKQPEYIFDQILPLIETRCRVHVQDEFLERRDLFRLFNRAKVYLYAFAPQRSLHSPTGWRMMEGFATQVLEAAACGCIPVADFRGGHGDVNEPWVFGYRLGCHSPEWDAHKILLAVNSFPLPQQDDYARQLQEHYGEAAFRERARNLVAFFEDYLAFQKQHPPNVAPFRLPRSIPRLLRWREWLYRRTRFLRIEIPLFR